MRAYFYYATVTPGADEPYDVWGTFSTGESPHGSFFFEEIGAQIRSEEGLSMRDTLVVKSLTLIGQN